jgi:hypothetical protein
MDKYQLSEVDIQGEVTEAFGKRDVFRDGKRKPYQNVPVYMSILAVAVARFNDCQSVFERRFDEKRNVLGKVICFRGFENDVTLAIAMFNSLMANMNRLCKAFIQAKGITGRHPRDIDTAFKIGCAHELVRRLNDLTQTRNEVTTTENVGTALMVVKKNERVNEHFGDWSTSPVKFSQAQNRLAVEAELHGRIEGRKMEIQPNVNSGRAGYLEE